MAKWRSSGKRVNPDDFTVTESGQVIKKDDTEEISKPRKIKNSWYDDKKGLFHCLMQDGTEWTSPTGSAQDWTRVLKKEVVPPNTGSHVKPADNPVLEIKLSDEYMHKHMEEAMDYAKKTKDMEGEFLPDTQAKIKAMLGGMCDLLLYKNHKYGDSALNPLGIFTKHIKNCDESTASILVRLDDKLSRVRNADSLRTNDVADILGYCTLLLISMGVTREDLAKFMD